jgi:hypothetical protein
MIPDTKEIERTASALDDVLDRHLGPRPSDRIEGPHRYMVAMDVIPTARLPVSATLGAIKPKEEREKWLKVQEAAREFAQAWRDLGIFTADAARRASFRLGRQHRDAFHLVTEEEWSATFGNLRRIDRIIREITPAVNDFIDAAPVARKQGMVSIAVIDDLRFAWQQRKGIPAPENPNDESPFAEYIRDAFDVLGLQGNPRSAMRAWREYTDANQKI